MNLYPQRGHSLLRRTTVLVLFSAVTSTPVLGCPHSGHLRLLIFCSFHRTLNMHKLFYAVSTNYDIMVVAISRCAWYTVWVIVNSLTAFGAYHIPPTHRLFLASCSTASQHLPKYGIFLSSHRKHCTYTYAYSVTKTAHLLLFPIRRTGTV